MSNEQLTEQLNRIERKLSVLISEKKKQLWVSYKVVQDQTGWDAEGLRSAREKGYVTYKKENGMLYDLNSIHEKFLKK